VKKSKKQQRKAKRGRSPGGQCHVKEKRGIVSKKARQASKNKKKKKKKREILKERKRSKN